MHSFGPVSVTYDVFQLGLEVRGCDDHDRQSIVQHRLQHVGRVGCVQRQVGGACDRVTNHRQRYLSCEVKIQRPCTGSDQSQTALLDVIS